MMLAERAGWGLFKLLKDPRPHLQPPAHRIAGASFMAEHTLFKHFYVPFGGWLTFVISAGCFLAQDVRFCRLLCASGPVHIFTYVNTQRL